MRVYKASIDAAALLGIRWVRPLPRSETPDSALLKTAFDELIEYAGERDITILIENFGWMMNDENSVVDLVKPPARTASESVSTLATGATTKSAILLCKRRSHSR